MPHPTPRKSQVAANAPGPSLTKFSDVRDGPDIEAALAPLTPQRADFVRHYLATGNGAEAVRRSGYNNRTPQRQAHKLLQRADVQTALAAAKKSIAAATAYDFERASTELKRATEFAYSTENATAAVRGAELLAKMHGHLSDRLDVRQSASVEFIFPSFGGPSQDRVSEQAAKTIEGTVVDGVATVMGREAGPDGA